MTATNTKPSRLRTTFTWITVACLLFFITGGALVFFRLIEPSQYVVYSGMVGGLASVLGLISLARPALNQDDIDGLELQSLRRLADASEEIKRLESARSAAEVQIGSLEAQKRQMEFLVQKASLSLFLKEQRRLQEERVRSEAAKNKDLLEGLEQLSGIDRKLEALDEEISRDPNVELLQRVIAEADEFIPSQRFSHHSPSSRAFLEMTEQILRILVRRW